MEGERDIYQNDKSEGSENKGGALHTADGGGVPMKRMHSPGCMPQNWLLLPSVAYCTSVLPNSRKRRIFHPPNMLMM